MKQLLYPLLKTTHYLTLTRNQQEADGTH